MKKSIFSLVQLWKIRILLGFMFFCMPMMGFALGSHDHESSAIRNITYTPNLFNNTYCGNSIEMTWKVPDASSFDNYCYLLYLDNNNDGKFKGKTEVFTWTPHDNYAQETNKGDIPPLVLELINPTSTSDDTIIEFKDLGQTKTIKKTFNYSTLTPVRLILASYRIETYNVGGKVIQYILHFSYSDLNFIVDPVAPTTSVTTMGETWTNATIAMYASATDGQWQSGVSRFEYSVINDYSWVPTPSSYVTFDTNFPDGSHRVFFRAIDNVGNIGVPASGLVNLDRTLPVISITIPPSSLSSGTEEIWSNKVLALTADATDATSGLVSTYTWNRVKDGITTSLAEKGAVCKGFDDGRYVVTCNVSDNAGNVGTATRGVFIDTIPPEVRNPPRLAFETPATGETITKLKVDWNAGTDDILTNTVSSGIKNYTVHYRYKSTDADAVYQSVFFSNKIPIDVNKPLTDVIVLPEDLNRQMAHIIQVAIVAKDNFENVFSPTDEQKVQYSEIILPAKVEGFVVNSKIIDSGEPGNPNIVMKMQLKNITLKRAKADYRRLTFIRASSTGTDTRPDRTPLPDDTLLLKKFIIEDTDFDKLVDPEDTTGQQLILTDIMSVKTSVGHRYIRYEIYGTPKNHDFDEANSVTTEHLLPNNPGSITWKLIDPNGHEIRIDSTGNKIQDPEFKIYLDGWVNVSFIGNDIDQEKWAIELDRTTKVHASPDVIHYVRISGKNTTPYDTKAGSINENTFPVTLSYGRNTLIFMWDEGNPSPDNNIEKNKSEILNIMLDSPTYGEDGVYSFNITDDEANYDSRGITVRPGEPLSIEVKSMEATVPTYEWDFGDGSEMVQGESITHPYPQKSGAAQLTDTAKYSLNLKITEGELPNVTLITLPILVRDTQVGELYVSEVWRGEHTITGYVIVPSMMKLQIGSPALNSDMTVEMAGGVGAGYMQGIRIKTGAELNIDNAGNKVFFTERLEQGRGWGTIFVENGGKATIRDSVFKYADRAVTATGSSKVDISGCLFQLNKTGLHVFGGSAVTVSDSVFDGNTVYGIKEEKNATPKLTGNRIFDNSRDYYSWNLGLLTIDGINNLTGNSKNVGE